MKISQRDAKLLIFLGCAIILGLAYFFGYRQYSEKTDDLDEKMQSLQTQYDTLSASNVHRQEYMDKIKEDTDKIQTIVAKYPSMVSNQDEIYLSSIMEKNSGAWINTFNFSEPTIVYTLQNLTAGETQVSTDSTTNTDPNATVTPSPAPTQTPEGTDSNNADVNPNANPKVTDAGDPNFYFVGYKNTTRIGFQSDYEQLKKIVQFIYDYASRKVINSITVAVDKNTGLLIGTMEYDSYSVVGAGTKYEPLTIPSHPMGVKNIFGDTVNNDQNDNTQNDTNVENDTDQ